MCVNNLSKVALDSAAAGIWTHDWKTRDLSVASPTPWPLCHRSTHTHIYRMCRKTLFFLCVSSWTIWWRSGFTPVVTVCTVADQSLDLSPVSTPRVRATTLAGRFCSMETNSPAACHAFSKVSITTLFCYKPKISFGSSRHVSTRSTCRACRAVLFQRGGRRTNYSARLCKFSCFYVLTYTNPICSVKWSKLNKCILQ